MRLLYTIASMTLMAAAFSMPAGPAFAQKVCVLFCPKIDICEMKFGSDGTCSCTCKAFEADKVAGSAIAGLRPDEMVSLLPGDDKNLSFRSVTDGVDAMIAKGVPKFERKQLKLDGVPEIKAEHQTVIEGGTREQTTTEKVIEAFAHGQDIDGWAKSRMIERIIEKLNTK